MIIRMTCVVNEVVITEIFLYKGNIDRATLKIQMKHLSLFVEEVFDLDSLPVRGLEVSSRIGYDQYFEGRLGRPSGERGGRLSSAHHPSHSETTAKKLSAIEKQLPGNMDKPVVNIEDQVLGVCGADRFASLGRNQQIKQSLP